MLSKVLYRRCLVVKYISMEELHKTIFHPIPFYLLLCDNYYQHIVYVVGDEFAVCFLLFLDDLVCCVVLFWTGDLVVSEATAEWDEEVSGDGEDASVDFEDFVGDEGLEAFEWTDIPHFYRPFIIDWTGKWLFL